MPFSQRGCFSPTNPCAALYTQVLRLTDVNTHECSQMPSRVYNDAQSLGGAVVPWGRAVKGMAWWGGTWSTLTLGPQPYIRDGLSHRVLVS